MTEKQWSDPISEQRWKAHVLGEKWVEKARTTNDPEQAKAWMEAADAAFATAERCQRIENDQTKAVLGRW